MLNPGESYEVEYSSGGASLGASPFTMKGIAVSGEVAGVWDTILNPIVLTGDITIPSGDTLRIAPGTRIMAAGEYSINVAGKLVAQGIPGDTGVVLFGPYRHLGTNPDTAAAGDWKGIHVEDSPDGSCSLDYCVIEYAGGTPGVDSAAVYCEAGNSGDTIKDY